MRYDHIGVPTTCPFAGESPLPHLKITVSDHLDNPCRIQWLRYWPDAPYPELVKTVAHVAFEMDDLAAAIAGPQSHHRAEQPEQGRARRLH